MSIPSNEHLHRSTVVEQNFYPDHGQRVESHYFVATKEYGHQLAIPCAISGQTVGVEYHHIFCEWAYTNGVDWNVVKGVGTGAITRLPVLDLVTDLPTVETFAAEHSLLWMICHLVELRGFDWHAFDPTDPASFVDSMCNMLVLHAKYHRHVEHGIHEVTFPVWIFQAMPRVPGFVFSPDELPSTQAPTLQ